MSAQTVRIFQAKQFRLRHDIAKRTTAVLRLGQALPDGVEQFGVESLFVEGAPDLIVGQTLHRLDSGLAAVPLFGQRLNKFQGVETVGIGHVIRDRDNLAQARAAFHIRRRTAPRDRQ